MRCVRLNVRAVLFLIVSVILNRVNLTQMDENTNNAETNTQTNNQNIIELSDNMFEKLECPSDKECNELNYPCISCTLPTKCQYGKEENVSCTARSEVVCKNRAPFNRSMICRYCYQTEPWEHTCILQSSCKSVGSPKQYYKTNCTVHNEIVCLGNRIFPKRMLCNWTGGHRWTTTLALSITLGGFGADRFYLGHWQEGIGKLFSFGGLGVWTLIDVVLISLHYLGPADGSLYL